jgi:hypothetical protein
MSPIYRSQVPRCWDVTHCDLPSTHFFAFGLRSDFDQVRIYGVISNCPEKLIVLKRDQVESDINANIGQKRPLPRSLCRLILTGKPLVESVITLQAKRAQLQAKRDLILSSADSTDLIYTLQQELWFTDDYLDRLHGAIAHLYHQVVAESELIQFDSLAGSEASLREADSRAEHVERLLDILDKEKGKDQQKKWSFPKMFNRSL